MFTSVRPSLVCALALALAMAWTPVVVRAGEVLEWNMMALQAIETSQQSAPEAARSLAMVHAAIYDAVNGIDGGFQSYYVSGASPSGASAQAAAASAARTVLSQLFPSMSASFDALYNQQTNGIANGAAKDDGINWGSDVAIQILSWRTGDGAANAASTAYNPNGGQGDWAPTPDATGLVFSANPLLPGWGNVNPFAMTSGTQFRPTSAPDMTSTTYTNDYLQVHDYGAKFGSLRSADETAAAYYWAEQTSSVTQVGHWNQISGHLLNMAGADLRTEARVLAALNVSLADAGIAAWDAIYENDTWRPLTAIAYGDVDPNIDTISDPAWEPLLVNPTLPEYVSDVAAFSGAAGGVLIHYFGDVAFSYQGDTDGDGIYDAPVAFSSISDAVLEAMMSGVYAGTNFATSGVQGAETGDNVAGWTLANYFAPVVVTVPEPSSALLALLALGLLRRRRAAQA